ncbi:putative cardiolipin synthase [Pseudorhodobacter antarcticus]|uniref:Phospholipase D n=1 Tax=Pseudorhodobacter antarcticus TaxID=1077947 RepID=A0A1H8JZK1_9RHOB|nr:phospholipase D family protein [Pseudorhodobacter antarcticus]SEN86092.1 putative cardiolipin synthase [Pseudorhodobacter antarcticus]
MLILIKIFLGFGVVVSIAVMLARWAFAVPKGEERANSTALPPATSGRLALALASKAVGQTGKTGVLALQDGDDAFAARIMLADAAVASIDAQYYIWRGDLTGYLLLDALLRAADRGVRIRLLLDDNGVWGLDRELAALHAHPNVQVRLYNPFNLRRFKALSYAFDFFRLNRRMHNKSFTVDGLVTILGGRNVGDAYFKIGEAALFVDLDILAVGAIVAHVAADFDRYWAAPSVLGVDQIIRPTNGGDPIGDGLARFQSNPQFTDFQKVLERSDVIANMAKGDLGLEWTRALLVSDDPIKGQGAVRREDLLATKLMQAVGEIGVRFDGVSPYLVPGAAGVRAFAMLTKRGVAVRMLTNSLEATDVVPVHAGYAKRRRALLRAGVDLFELHARKDTQTPRVKKGPFGSSGASLHAKTFAVDGARIFVGSFNFDPRSTTLNTEMGLLIESAVMAEALHAAFDLGLSGVAWQVKRKDLRLVWIDQANGKVLTQEPGSTLFKRVVVMVVGWLPVEWLL